ncbi:MAG: pyridoxamine 5'-phosphate oxidase family protein [Ilumatobacteraceae bacterium]
MSTPPREHVQYQSDVFDVGDLAATPFEQWQRWYADALAADVPEPDAMIVATVDDADAPDARVVLLRDIDDRGPVFYTSYESAKSTQLDARPVAAGVVTWVTLHRQVRFRGAVERADAHQSDALLLDPAEGQSDRRVGVAAERRATRPRCARCARRRRRATLRGT